ncbi:MAG: hypothetical protein IJ146_02785 [Kiritimatiellae bacterium]|nr:hypothetical protein [Kiritimatiellia bacterium]
MTEKWKVFAAVAAMALFAGMTFVKLRLLWRRPLHRAVAFCRMSAASALFLAALLVGVVRHGVSKVARETDRASRSSPSTQRLTETEQPLRDGDGGPPLPPEVIRFTVFAVDTNAVHFAASLPPDIDLPERRLDLFAAYDLNTNAWELVGNYDIPLAVTNLVDAIPLATFPFPAMDRLFLALGTRADLDGDGLIDAREKFMFGTSPNFADTDGDGVLDGDELAQIPPVDPLNPDSDGDGYLDGEELLAGTSPLLENDGADVTIRYYYDDDDRLTAAYAGSAEASSVTALSPAGNPARQSSK